MDPSDSSDYYSEEEKPAVPSRRGRLVKLKDEGRSSEAASDEEEEPRAATRHQPTLERLFPSAKPADEELEARARLIARTDLNAIFSRKELSTNYEMPEDRLIAATDRPERLQLRAAERRLPTDDELDREIKWISEKLLLTRTEWAPHAEELFGKVKTALDLLVLGGFEVMYQWTYRRKEFCSVRGKSHVDFELKDLWRIYELDAEWVIIYGRRRAAERLFGELGRFTLIPNALLDYFRRAYSNASLAHVEAWVEYQIRKYAGEGVVATGAGEERTLTAAACPRGEGQRPLRRLKRRVFANEMEKAGVTFLMDRFALTCDELAENLEAGNQRHKPRILNEEVKNAIEQYVRGDVPELSEKLSALRSICTFIAGEYAHYPPVRAQLRRLFERRCGLWTGPTEKGRNLNVYSKFYATKRVQNKSPSEVRPEHWLLIREAVKLGLVTVEFRLAKEELARDLSSLSCTGTTDDKWDLVRQEVAQRLVDIFEPEFDRQIRAELTEAGENAVIAQCTAAFRQLLFVKPYRSGDDISVLSGTVSRTTAYLLLVDGRGEPSETLVLHHLLKGRFGADLNHVALYDEDVARLRAFLRRTLPTAVVVLPRSQRCHYLKVELGNAMEDPWPTEVARPFVMWAEPRLPAAFAALCRERGDENLDSPLFEALSAARYLQNPLAETLSLWSDNDAQNRLLSIEFAELQRLVPLPKLRRAFENVVVEIVNLVGVDIAPCLRCPRQASVLPFICGLGPRKARQLLEKLRSLGSLQARRELLPDTARPGAGLLDPLVFVNAAGFLRPEGRLSPALMAEGERQDREWLDFTRVHPDNYPLATKIAREAADERDSDGNRAVLRALRDPKSLATLELEDYADYLATHKSSQNMIVVLNFIVEEFNAPFGDPRAEFPTRRAKEEIFAALAAECADEVREEALVSVRVVVAEENSLRVVFVNGLQGQIPRQACEAGPYEDLAVRYPPGSYLKARVKTVFHEMMKVRLSATRDDLTNHRLYLARHDVLGRYGLEDGRNFRVVREEDFPVIAVERRTRTALPPRRVSHPFFRNIGVRAALERLSEAKPGQFIFRPSSRDPEQLNLTWLFVEGCVVHVVVREGQRNPKEALSQTLTVEGVAYSSLDDIVSNLIRPVNIAVTRIVEHEKFCGRGYDYIKQTLLESYEADNSRIPYLFWFSPRAPLHLVLSYIIVRGQLRHELVRLKPSGLLFHGLTFPALPAVIRYFKEKFRTDEYRRQLESQPQVVFEEEEVPRRAKEEFMLGAKQEYGRRGDGLEKRVKVEDFGVKAEYRFPTDNDHIKSEYRQYAR